MLVLRSRHVAALVVLSLLAASFAALPVAAEIPDPLHDPAGLEAGGKLCGFVTANGQAQAGLRVIVLGPTLNEDITDANGYYELGAARGLTHVVLVLDPRPPPLGGYAFPPVQKPLQPTTASCPHATNNFELSPASAVRPARVVAKDATDGAVISGALVSFAPRCDQPAAAVPLGRTSSEGDWEGLIPLVEGCFTASATDYVATADSATVNPGGPSAYAQSYYAPEPEHVIRLPRLGATTSITARDAVTGAAVSGAVVTVPTAGAAATCTTAASGACSLLLPWGTHSVVVERASGDAKYLAKTSTLEVPKDATNGQLTGVTGEVTLSVELARATLTASGLVKDVDGAALPGATVTFETDDGYPPVTATTAADGSFSRVIPWGDYDVVASKSGFYPDAGAFTQRLVARVPGPATVPAFSLLAQGFGGLELTSPAGSTVCVETTPAVCRTVAAGASSASFTLPEGSWGITGCPGNATASVRAKEITTGVGCDEANMGPLRVHVTYPPPDFLTGGTEPTVGAVPGATVVAGSETLADQGNGYYGRKMTLGASLPVTATPPSGASDCYGPATGSFAPPGTFELVLPHKRFAFPTDFVIKDKTTGAPLSGVTFQLQNEIQTVIVTSGLNGVATASPSTFPHGKYDVTLLSVPEGYSFALLRIDLIPCADFTAAQFSALSPERKKADLKFDVEDASAPGRPIPLSLQAGASVTALPPALKSSASVKVLTGATPITCTPPGPAPNSQQLGRFTCVGVPWGSWQVEISYTPIQQFAAGYTFPTQTRTIVVPKGAASPLAIPALSIVRDTGALKVTVIDSFTQQEIPGATVKTVGAVSDDCNLRTYCSLSPSVPLNATAHHCAAYAPFTCSGTTAADGSATLRMPFGHYAVEASAPGYVSAARPLLAKEFVQVKAGATPTEVVVAIDRLDWEVAGTVTVPKGYQAQQLRVTIAPAADLPGDTDPTSPNCSATDFAPRADPIDPTLAVFSVTCPWTPLPAFAASGAFRSSPQPTPSKVSAFRILVVYDGETNGDLLVAPDAEVVLVGPGAGDAAPSMTLTTVGSDPTIPEPTVPGLPTVPSLPSIPPEGIPPALPGVPALPVTCPAAVPAPAEIPAPLPLDPFAALNGAVANACAAAGVPPSGPASAAFGRLLP